MKLITKYLFILVLFFSFNVFAACKFEFIPMKSSFSKFEKNINISMHMASSEDDIKSYPIPDVHPVIITSLLERFQQR